MITIQIDVEIPMSALSPEEGYARIDKIIKKMATVHPSFSDWFGGLNNADDKFVSFRQRKSFIERLKLSIDKGYEHEGVTVRATTDGDVDGPEKEGCATIWISPTSGFLRIDIWHPLEAFGPEETTRICKEILCMVVKIEHASFAYVDVIARIKNHKSPKTFKRIFATFPHRKCLGWMAFVPKIVTAEQLPLAAELINIPKKGTIIVAVNDPFDLTNMAHIRRTNEIEMDMVDLDLLPLTDPSFL